MTKQSSGQRSSEPAETLQNLKLIHLLAWTSLMAALIAVGGVVAIPINPLSPVPVTLQTLFVMMAGLVLGPRAGIKAVALYLLAGLAGLPVFAGGKGGLAVLIGPTGGFLVGFLITAAICGLAKKTPPRPFWALIAYCVAATAATLLFGMVWLAKSLDIGLPKAFAVGVLPFLPGAALKIAAAAAICRFMSARKLLPF